MLRCFGLSVCLLICVAGDLDAAEPASEGTSITIYSDSDAESSAAQSDDPFDPMYGSNSEVHGWAVVKLRRKVRLAQGRGEFELTDVARSLIPPSVSLRSLTNPDHTLVLEQNFLYDVANVPSLLERYLGQTVVAVPRAGQGLLEGRLCAAAETEDQKEQRLTLDVPGVRDPIRLTSCREIRLPRLPSGLRTRPTLLWRVDAAKGGEHLVEITYLANRVSWRADYTLLLSPKEDTFDLSAWATIQNESGATYEQARLKLMGGDVQKLREKPQSGGGAAANPFCSVAEAPPVAFTEQSFFEYHLYTLGRPTTIADRSKKQIELFEPVSGVPCRKVLVYEGGRGQYLPYSNTILTDQEMGFFTNTKVDVYLEFRNDKQGHLGLPLPAGTVRVYRNDPRDGQAEFVGEDEIKHTPKDEKVLLRLGESFDVVGERRQTAFEVNADGQWLTEGFEILLRNHKREPVTVIVKEKLYRWNQWKITQQSHAFEKVNADTIRFAVEVPAGGETRVTYTARYEW